MNRYETILEILMSKLIIGILRANVLNLIVILLLTTVLISTFGFRTGLPHGLAGLTADRHASNFAQTMFLVAIMLGGFLSGSMSRHLIVSRPDLSGVLSCIGVAGSLIFHELISGPSSHDDILPTVKVGSCLVALCAGAIGGRLRVRFARPQHPERST